MNLFDLIIVQPIFNALMFIYAVIPGGDFGISIIIFTILVRLLFWPLVKKQLHQTKAMREMQPELKKIKVRAKGNKQLQAQLQMELFRERGVSPFGAIGILLVQLPIFIALFRVITIVTSERDRIEAFTYGPIQQLEPIRALIADPSGFNETLLGIVDLSSRAFGDGGFYFPVIIIAAIAAGFQFIQSKQLMPQDEKSQRLRDLLKQQAAGKEVDQSEISQTISRRMVMILPVMTLFIGLYLPAAIVLYFAVQSIVAVIQQQIVLNRDAKEMDKLADKNGNGKKPRLSGQHGQATVKERAQNAKPAEVVTEPQTPPKKRTKKRKKRR
jgi:YidC/Oxa1 family membrane protein insertase